jgi:hypothetical protein
VREENAGHESGGQQRQRIGIESRRVSNRAHKRLQEMSLGEEETSTEASAHTPVRFCLTAERER